MWHVDPRIVLQIESLQGSRRVWVACIPDQRGGYRTVGSPTQDLPEFCDLPVSGLLCAETPAGRDRIAGRLSDVDSVSWKEVSIAQARRIARQLARQGGGVVHLALFDEPHRVVWEPVVCP